MKDYSQSSHAVSANGTILSLQQVDLKSQSNGKITNINVKIGDHVRLRPGAGNIRLPVPRRSPRPRARWPGPGRIAKLIAGASNEQIGSAKIAVNNATTALANTKASQDTAVQNAFSTLLNSSITAVASAGNPDAITPIISGTYTGSAQGTYTVTYPPARA